MIRNLHAGTLVLFALAILFPSFVFANVTFEWALVGNPGNAADPLNSGSVPGIGSVAEIYLIAKHEVTNSQYSEFLNAVAATDTFSLYNTNMGSDDRGGIVRNGSPGSYTYSVKTNMGNKPVNFISFFRAMRFVNWLHNGHPTGTQGPTTTESGVYAVFNGMTETRAPGARYFLPTENEWYKAAYHQPSADGGDADDFWLYPTASNAIPVVASANATGDISNPGADVANYNNGSDWNGQNGHVTTVGSAGPLARSYYGTSDQGGNLLEWNETLIDVSRGRHGGAYDNFEHPLQSSFRIPTTPSLDNVVTGFRVAATVSAGDVPAVSEWALTAMAILLLIAGTIVHRQRGRLCCL